MNNLLVIAMFGLLLIPSISNALNIKGTNKKYDVIGSVVLKKTSKIYPKRPTNCRVVQRSCTYAEIGTYNWNDLTPYSPIEIVPPSISGAVDRINECIEEAEPSCQSVCESGNQPPRVYIEFDPDLYEGSFFFNSSCVRNGIRLECEEDSTSNPWTKLVSGSNGIPLCHEGVFYFLPLTVNSVSSNRCTLPDVYGGTMLSDAGINLGYSSVSVGDDTVDLTLKVETYSDGCRASIVVE